MAWPLAERDSRVALGCHYGEANRRDALSPKRVAFKTRLARPAVHTIAANSLLPCAAKRALLVGWQL